MCFVDDSRMKVDCIQTSPACHCTANPAVAFPEPEDGKVAPEPSSYLPSKRSRPLLADILWKSFVEEFWILIC